MADPTQNQQELNPNEQAQQQAVHPAQSAPQAPPQPDPNDAEFLAFQEQLKRYTGYGINDFVGSIQAVQNIQRQTEQQQLQSAWGQNYESNFAEVEERLKEIHSKNPAMAASLNNAEGAKLVYAQIQLEKQQSSQQAGGGVPSFQRTQRAGLPQPQEPVFTEKQISEMTKDERRQRHAEIAAAYAQGLVARG